MSARAERARAPRAPERPRLRVVRRRRTRGLIRRKGARRIAPAAILAAILAVALVFGVLLEQVVLARSAYELWDVRNALTAYAKELE